MQESLPQYREAGKLTATEARVKNGRPSMKPGVKSVVIDRNIPTPQPPFTGFRHVTAIDPAELFSYVNEQALFRGRWGYRRTASSSAEEYAELTRTTVRPIYEELKQRALQEGLLQPKAAYGYFRCYSEGDTVYVENGDETLAFDFPRQQSPPHLCIADYYRSREEGGGYRRFLRGDHRGEDRRRDQAPV
jgi:5-methyltetrahydrofolate--homocysteine methyltransferase